MKSDLGFPSFLETLIRPNVRNDLTMSGFAQHASTLAVACIIFYRGFMSFFSTKK